MQKIDFSRQFLKDRKKWSRSGVSMQPLEAFICTIQYTWPPPAQYEPHLLAGPMDGIWDIHLRQNWIVLLRFDAGIVLLLRMGTHGELGL